MEIKQVPIGDLKLAEYNPRKASRKEWNDLKDSLKKFGFVEPIIVNSAKERENIIVGGHFRIKVAKDLGIKEVPVLYVNLPKIEDEQELNLRLNKNVGQWDWDMLANLNEQMLLNVGFDQTELDKLFKGEQDNPDIVFTQELMEEHNYLVLYCDNSVDWLFVQSLYPLKKVKALASKEGFELSGIGRVVKAVDFINYILKNK
jgi:hypothetical protein